MVVKEDHRRSVVGEGEPEDVAGRDGGPGQCADEDLPLGENSMSRVEEQCAECLLDAMTVVRDQTRGHRGGVANRLLRCHRERGDAPPELQRGADARDATRAEAADRLSGDPFTPRECDESVRDELAGDVERALSPASRFDEQRDELGVCERGSPAAGHPFAWPLVDGEVVDAEVFQLHATRFPRITLPRKRCRAAASPTREMQASSGTHEVRVPTTSRGPGCHAALFSAMMPQRRTCASRSNRKS